ncbi:hypothetical protein FNF31_03928 [Cafeteria roenbergensis]|uniref:Signal peptide peptidase n=1 Tax=Cafeteria roenbergensis TaxID=33653 RepID=A0A5A8D9S6_CAFRO|nr:hypothetical protein FNF31_03928 [Cafeteria roenbergensis]
MSAVMRGRVLGALGILAAVHALTHLELLPVPFWVITLTVSMLLIYGGSLYSLMLSRFASESDEGEAAMSQQDAILMPIIASGVLLVLFYSFDFIPDYAVNGLLRVYFGVLGTFGVGSMAAWVLEAVGTQAGVVTGAVRLGELPFGMGSYTAFDLLGLCVGAAVSAAEAYAKLNGLSVHWILNNAMGAAFCFEALGKFSLGRVSTGVVMLVGLLIYDIVMVFGTKGILGRGVMQSVAAKVDGPILLMFPNFSTDPDVPVRFSKLGLGDICFPGAFIAMLLRYDAFRSAVWRHTSVKGTADEEAQLAKLAKDSPNERVPAGLPGGAATTHKFSSPYFIASAVAYLAGLAVTLVVMLVFKHPQPALLYLSPACALAPLVTAFALGDFKQMWGYTEEAEEDAAKDKAAAQKKEEAVEPAPVAVADGGSKPATFAEVAATEPPVEQAAPEPERPRG